MIKLVKAMLCNIMPKAVLFTTIPLLYNRYAPRFRHRAWFGLDWKFHSPIHSSSEDLADEQSKNGATED